MSFLTIFTTPKPFVNPHINLIQRNAIRNWTQFGEDVNVVMIGDEEGMADVAAEYGVTHIKEVESNEKGIPYISSLFKIGREAFDSDVILYLNADILIFPDMIQAARDVAAQHEKFMVVGQRYDVDVTELVDFSDGWEARLREKMQREGVLHKPTGSDYFLLSNNVMHEIPAFTVGRAGWDNWMIWKGVTETWPTIDGTFAIDIVHQNHDYHHLQGGQKHYTLPESRINEQKGGGTRNMYLVLDTNRELREGKVVWPHFSWIRLWRRIERWLTPNRPIDGTIQWRLTRMLRQKRKRNLSRG